MTTVVITTFILGYILIALGETVRINKAATALILGTALWCMYIFSEESIISGMNPASFHEFITSVPGMAHLSPSEQAIKYVVNLQIIKQLGNISEILFYLLGAMTIVKLIEMHGGFSGITNVVTTRNKKKLLWLTAFITFFMSSVLDNMTSAIVMITLLQKLIANQRERWYFGGIVIIAANAGGAWTPIGDITTIMLWMNENITSGEIIKSLFLPGIVSLAIPVWIVAGRLQTTTVSTSFPDSPKTASISPRERNTILIAGTLCLLLVPVFKSLTHLPPFMGILFMLGILWIYTEIMYNRKTHLLPGQQYRVPRILSEIDLSTVLFFLGILMAVGALEAMGILNSLTTFLNHKIHDIYFLNLLIGLLSSVIDNVPLTAALMEMYPVLTPENISALPNAAYLANFEQNGQFWELVAYSTGTGGSLLIIGSAAGVVAMGLAKISFMWYLKKISWIALTGFLAGTGVYYLLHL